MILPSQLTCASCSNIRRSIAFRESSTATFLEVELIASFLISSLMVKRRDNVNIRWSGCAVY